MKAEEATATPGTIINQMNKNTINNGMIAEDTQGSGEVSGGMVWDRAEELGKIAGRPMNNVDYGQALHELRGGHSVPEAGHNQMHWAEKAP
jgi:hypothetical protein